MDSTNSISSNYEKRLKRLCDDLHLPFQSQDWGISVADAKRVIEFIDYYEKNSQLDSISKGLLGELIFASFNDMLEGDSLRTDINEKVAAFVRRHQQEQATNLDYWSGLRPTEEDPFPISHWLRQLLSEGKG